MDLTIKMAQCIGHQIRVELLSGDVFEGRCVSFTPPFDNEPEIAEFNLKRAGYDGLLSINKEEIKSISVID